MRMAEVRLLALPEIEVVRRDLEKEVVGRRVKDVEVRPGSRAMKVIRRHGRRKEFQDLLVGAKVESIDRVAKSIGLELDNDRVLVVDLGDTGQLLKTSASDGVASHTHICIGFTIGGQLRVVDPTLSGEVYVSSKADFETFKKESNALDPFDNQPFTWHHFSGLLEQEKIALKAALTNEEFVSGLGSIYSDEVLFAAGLRYDRGSHSLSSQDVRRLYRAMMETMQDALKARGTTWGSSEFKDLAGNPGQYQLELKVYERDGEACRRCRNIIVRESFEDQDTYLCPQCQT
jgi:formamidopyrimidine-DNA glycosylase